ncbi:MAG: L,D-transpeptidase family protein [Acidobacteriota bacterium]
MNKLFFTILLFLIIGMMNDTAAQNFKSQQQKFPRVQTAFAEKESTVRKMFAAKQLTYPARAIFLRAFKRESVIELWVQETGQFHLLKTYNVCAASGGIGPKREQGDNQVPEGFYTIDRFNPVSSFYLSLGLNYPNASDRILGARGNLGGDIFIHGNCVSIGCMAITDEQIKELYLIAVEARASGQTQIPVQVFPLRMNEAGMRKLEQKAAGNATLLRFWRNLKTGYDVFETQHRLPVVTVDTQGQYVFR